MNRFVLKGVSLSFLSVIFCGPVLAATQIEVFDRLRGGVGVKELLVTIQKTDAKGGASSGNIITVKVGGNTYLQMPETAKARSVNGYKISDLVIVKDRGNLTQVSCDVSEMKNTILHEDMKLSLSINRYPSAEGDGIKSCNIKVYG
ncbi:MAG: hypothetical protein K2X53_01690 [Alphaproteobacteria bacterium]|nr:hypothetical protein [Alphaproteobacteria bacterium]